MATTGERITQLRVHLRYSQRKFATLIGKTGTHVSRIESNEAPVLESTIDSIVLKFNVNRDWLLTGEGEMFQRDSNSYSANAPEWAQELMKKIDKLMEIQTTQTGKMLELLGKQLGNQITYSEDKKNECKIISLTTDSVTHAAERAA